MLSKIIHLLTLSLFWLLPPHVRGFEIIDGLPPIHDFSLKDTRGNIISKKDLLGKVWVASFIVTRCPDGKCPQVTQTIQKLSKKLVSRRDLQFVTFTTDPSRDDPEELRRYAEKHGADPGQWFFLTGTEAEIDSILRSFLLRSGAFKESNIEHSQKLILVDKKGATRGYFDGMDQPGFPEGYFESNLRNLEKEINRLQIPDLPSWMPENFPRFNASLNALSGLLLILGYIGVRLGKVGFHAVCMLSAIVVSAFFLASYLFFHVYVKGGQPTRYSDLHPDDPLWMIWLYFGILATHTILAIPVAPMAIFSAYQGLRGQVGQHRKLVRWTFPIWLYVSLTGVVVYVLLYRGG